MYCINSCIHTANYLKGQILDGTQIVDNLIYHYTLNEMLKNIEMNLIRFIWKVRILLENCSHIAGERSFWLYNSYLRTYIKLIKLQFYWSLNGANVLHSIHYTHTHTHTHTHTYITCHKFARNVVVEHEIRRFRNKNWQPQ